MCVAAKWSSQTPLSPSSLGIASSTAITKLLQPLLGRFGLKSHSIWWWSGSTLLGVSNSASIMQLLQMLLSGVGLLSARLSWPCCGWWNCTKYPSQIWGSALLCLQSTVSFPGHPLSPCFVTNTHRSWPSLPSNVALFTQVNPLDRSTWEALKWSVPNSWPQFTLAPVHGRSWRRVKWGCSTVSHGQVWEQTGESCVLVQTSPGVGGRSRGGLQGLSSLRWHHRVPL